MASDVNAVVSFNVGGQIFTTLKETVLKETNSRLSLIARGLLATVRDHSNGAYVIDRDPKYFQIILNWLRDGWARLPRTSEERRELMQEVRYYQLTALEGWLRSQELLSDTGSYSAPLEASAMETPQARMHHPFTYTQQPAFAATQQQHQSPMQQPPVNTYNNYAPFSSPASALAASTSPRAMVASRVHTPTASWMSTGTPPPSGFATVAAASAAPLLSTLHVYPSPGLGPGPGPGSPIRSTLAHGSAGLGPGVSGGGCGRGASGSAITAMREAFMAATGPQRPAPYVASYSLSAAADESSSWTSKYLRGNEPLRELVNTLLELAFAAPHRALNGGKVHLSIRVACAHGTEVSLVGSRDDQMRNKLLEVRVKGAMGWAFELTLRPNSEAALWDKYGGVAAGVQDNWFVLGAVLKDQLGVVLEEDCAARPACMACRRTCLSIYLTKIF